MPYRFPPLLPGDTGYYETVRHPEVPCFVTNPDGLVSCTRPKGHDGPHAYSQLYSYTVSSSINVQWATWTDKSRHTRYAAMYLDDARGKFLRMMRAARNDLLSAPIPEPLGPAIEPFEPGWEERVDDACGVTMSAVGPYCTLPPGHTRPHAAHGSADVIAWQWGQPYDYDAGLTDALRRRLKGW